MRVALVGLGDIGLGAHLPALLRNPQVEVVLLADSDPAKQSAARQWGLPVAADFDDVLDCGVDGVVLATPPWVTPALAVRAARAGLYVLAEKPIATSTEAAKVYESLTTAERARVQVGLTYRHDPAIGTLADWIANDVFGTSLLVRAHIYDEQHRPDDSEHTKRIHDALAHGMPIVHEGAHVFDWLSHLLRGEPLDIDDAWTLRTRSGLPNPNIVGARLTYPSGVALVEFGWLTAGLPRCEISVLGDRGHALLDGATFDLTLTTAGSRKEVQFEGERLGRCFDRQVARMVARRAEPSLADGIAALRTAERVSLLAIASSSRVDTAGRSLPWTRAEGGDDL